MPFCTRCGHDNPDGSNFCGQCGSALNVPAAPSTGSGATVVGSPGDPGERPPSGDTTKTMPAVVDGGDAETLSPDEEAAG